MFSEYKLYIIAAAFLVWSVGLWHVSGQVKENAFNQERLAQAKATLKVMEQNAALASSLTQALNDGLSKFREQAAKDKKGLEDAIKADKRYVDCTVTDSVRDQYKRKLEAQR